MKHYIYILPLFVSLSAFSDEDLPFAPVPTEESSGVTEALIAAAALFLAYEDDESSDFGLGVDEDLVDVDGPVVEIGGPPTVDAEVEHVPFWETLGAGASF